MKHYLKFVSAFVFVIMLCSAANAALPSITLLSTKSCPACDQMAQVLKEINSKYKGKISTSSVSLENHPEIAKKYNVRFAPTLIFKDASGKDFAQEVGYKSLQDVIAIFKNAGVKI